MAQYKTCPDCGAHLDHGEKCDCGKTEYINTKEQYSQRVGSDSEALRGRLQLSS